MDRILSTLAAELKVRPQQVQAAVALLDGGATVPFIARYRKEATDGLDDAQLRNLYVEVRRHNLEGELLTIEAEITGKREDAGRKLVDFSLVAHNQDGELSARGRATAELFHA